MSDALETNDVQAKKEDFEDAIKDDVFGFTPMSETTIKYPGTNESAVVPLSNETGDLSNFVRLRGLPFSAKVEDIKSFFGDIVVDNVRMTNTRDGRPSGECYCTLRNIDDANRAVATLNRKEMSNRYIEVFPVSVSEAEGLNQPGSVVAELEDRVIRLRGLPFSATKEDIINFLTGLTCDEVVIGQTGGRPSGEAYVRLATKEQAAQALELNRKMMGTRYIEIFRTNENDLERHRDRPRAGPYNGPRDFGGKPPSLLSLPYSNGDGYGRRDYAYNEPYGGGPVYPTRGPRSRPVPYDNPRRGGGPRFDEPYGRPSRETGSDAENFRNSNNVFMRGIPFDCQAAEIEKFFTPIICVDIKVGYNRENRPSGDAVVTFSNPHDVACAFEKNRKYLGRRYVELFSGRDAPPPMRSLVWRRIGGTGIPSVTGGYGTYPTEGQYTTAYDYADYKGSYGAAYGGSDPYSRSYGEYGGYGAGHPPGAGYGYDAFYQSGDYKGSYVSGPGGPQYGSPTALRHTARPQPPPPPPPPSHIGYGAATYPGRY